MKLLFWPGLGVGMQWCVLFARISINGRFDPYPPFRKMDGILGWGWGCRGQQNDGPSYRY
jgi:hypothetical protein